MWPVSCASAEALAKSEPRHSSQAAPERHAKAGDSSDVAWSPDRATLTTVRSPKPLPERPKWGRLVAWHGVVGDIERMAHAITAGINANIRSHTLSRRERAGVRGALRVGAAREDTRPPAWGPSSPPLKGDTGGCWLYESGVTYLTGGDGKRRSATVASVETQYRWDAGYTVLNEEDDTGDLERTYVGRNTAQIEGDDASTGDYLYHTHDHLGSTRNVYDQSKDQVAEFMYTPYGRELFATNRALTTRGYTGHAQEAALGGAYYAPFRYYHPSLARWEKRDPLGMVDGPNVYAYVGGNVVNLHDPMGLAALGLFCAGLLAVKIGIIAACASWCPEGYDLVKSTDSCGAVEWELVSTGKGACIKDCVSDAFVGKSPDQILHYLASIGCLASFSKWLLAKFGVKI